MSEGNSQGRFHGRINGQRQECAHPGCTEIGEFRAPGYRAPGFNGPGDYRWMCLDHIRAFNARYNFFDGMSRDEIEDAQMPLSGWATETRAFSQGGVDNPPKWTDFHDPLDAISARFKAGVGARMPKERTDGRPLSGEARRALATLGLDLDADRKSLRLRYAELVRKYHPDRNGGDRSFEKRLQAVVDAYQLLRKSDVFG